MCYGFAIHMGQLCVNRQYMDHRKCSFHAQYLMKLMLDTKNTPREHSCSVIVIYFTSLPPKNHLRILYMISFLSKQIPWLDNIFVTWGNNLWFRCHLSIYFDLVLRSTKIKIAGALSTFFWDLCLWKRNKGDKLVITAAIIGVWQLNLQAKVFHSRYTWNLYKRLDIAVPNS